MEYGWKEKKDVYCRDWTVEVQKGKKVPLAMQTATGSYNMGELRAICLRSLPKTWSMDCAYVVWLRCACTPRGCDPSVLHLNYSSAPSQLLPSAATGEIAHPLVVFDRFGTFRRVDSFQMRVHRALPPRLFNRAETNHAACCSTALIMILLSLAPTDTNLELRYRC